MISKSSRGILVDILDQQRRLLLKFGRIDDRLQPLRNPMILEDAPGEERSKIGSVGAFESRFPTTGLLLKKSLEFVKSTSRCPTGLRWAMSDRANIEELIRKLTGLNDFLKELLNGQQLELLASQHVRTDYQIMQLNSRLDHLEEIVASCSLQTPGLQRGYSRDFSNPPSYDKAMGLEFGKSSEGNQYGIQAPQLLELAQFKVLSSAIDTDTLTEKITKELDLGQSPEEITSVEITSSNISIIENDTSIFDSDRRVQAWYQKPNGTPQKVWIEWKECDPQFSHHQAATPDPRILKRLQALVALLRENRTTEQFKAPHCLGYFLPPFEETFLIGLVFENPPGTDQNRPPISLLELLQEEREKPITSLTARIKLATAIAECVERLHAVNWLHKGIRSQNILFFKNEKEGEVDITNPYLSGFDYSRPAANSEMTEKPPENPAHDLYRHPLAHGYARESDQTSDHRHGYRKHYDIYSLGIVLLEICFWKRIHEIVGIPDLDRLRASETVRVRGRLLNGAFLGALRGALGDSVEAVVGCCLIGLEAFGLRERDDEREGLVAARLQRGFYENVVRRLQDVRV